MSSKDLDDICSSDDDWGESMDVTESETPSALNNVNTTESNTDIAAQASHSLSPSVEMAESVDTRAQKSPIEMDPVSPSDKVTVPEVEMANPSDDTEMRDLTTDRSPEDLGELKSPSPTVEMIEEPIETIKSPIVEMKDTSDENIESELLNSPSREQEPENADICAEDEALKSPEQTGTEESVPIVEDSVTEPSVSEVAAEEPTVEEPEDFPDPSALVESELGESTAAEEAVESTSAEEPEIIQSTPAESEPAASEAEKAPETSADDDEPEILTIEPEISLVESEDLEKVNTSDDAVAEADTSDTRQFEDNDMSDICMEPEVLLTEDSKEADEKKADESTSDKPLSPDDDKKSKEQSKNKPSEFTGDDNSQLSDGIGDRDSVTNFDDESQCSGDARNKDLVNIRDNMEGVTVPGGADGDVNVEEEMGDDPLGAGAEKEDQDEEILGDTSSNEVSILPDSAKTVSPGCADGDVILPDSDKNKPEEILSDKRKDDKESEKDVEIVKEKEDAAKEDGKDGKETPKASESEETMEDDKVDGKEKESESKKDDEEKKTDDSDKDKEDASPVAVSDAATGADKEIEVMDIEDEEAELDEAELKGSQLAEPKEEECSQCKEKKECQYSVKTTKPAAADAPSSDDVEPIEEDVFLYICNRDCYRKYKGLPEKCKSSPVKPRLSVARPPMEMPMEVETPTVPFDPIEASKRRCSQCKQECGGTEANLSWETMDFCNEECLGQYQKELGSFCANCRGAVMSSSMGKYCVRFGFNVRQFCSSSCLEEFKKGLKVCSYCQRDITGDVEGFLAPIGDKGQFKDFCSQDCMAEYEAMSGSKPKPVLKASCAVCCEEKEVAAEVVYSSRNGGDLPRLSTPTHKLCSNPCLAAFKFANNLHTELCEMCKRNFDLSSPEHKSVYMNEELHHFCSKTCLNVKTISNRKIVACNWCKVKKYNFDMIRKIVGSPTAATSTQAVMLCSLNCLALYQVSVTATSSKLMTCDHCGTRAQGMYHLTMSDATLRNFCSYQCCMNFQTKFSNPILTTSSTQLPRPTGTPMLVSSQSSATSSTGIQASGSTSGGQMPVITNVTSLAPEPAAPPPPPQIKVVQQVFVKPKAAKTMSNRTTQCRPNTTTKGVSCRPICSSKGTQTDEQTPEKVLIPIPVPIYVPTPMHMFSAPFPVPVPFPLPIAVPIFIPTTRNSAKGISKEIKRIQEQIPRDPFEAELLMMAEMVAEDRTGVVTSSDSEDDNGADNMAAPSPQAESMHDAGSPAHSVEDQEVEYTDPTPSFGEDMLQMALKMATELTEPAAPSMDLETALPAMSAPPPQLQPQHQVSEEEDVPKPEPRAARKRGRTRNSSEWAPPGLQQTVKRTRTNSQEAAANQASQQTSRASNGSPPPEPQDPAIEADPNLSLKYTYGVLAFRKWIRQKNAELVAKSGRHAKTFKTDILQLSTDELNFALCMFVKEVRKPDGEEYAPDIIYYLCLGIQLYLYRSHRIDNIFTDAYYEKFTESLNDITLGFTSKLVDKAPLVTRVEEEHLWESQQLGAHSPHVLLFTLMYFNTKHFLLTEAEDHMRLSFTHVMKHWKRNHAQPGKTGSTRNVLLRYYPPQSVLDADERKKKVYEQQENENDPLRCPVKLYEFYVSKCPESVRGRNDVFYLLPERSCVPDSPVWYSTMALPREAVSKMLNRIRMVREVLSLLQSLNY